MPKAASETVMVVNNQSHTVFFPGATLRPGVNDVPRATAATMKKNPHITQVKGVSIADAPPATKGLDVDEAVELVEKTHDEKLLHKYRSEDERPAVAQAIVEKREELKKAKVTTADKDA